MKITIVGAAGGEVTGSAYYAQTKTASLIWRVSARIQISDAERRGGKLPSHLPAVSETIEL